MTREGDPLEGLVLDACSASPPSRSRRRARTIPACAWWCIRSAATRWWPAADLNGSTEYIVKVVEEAPAGTIWAIGTEINLVNRLAKEHPDKTIFCLDPVVCPCSTMYRIHPAYLAWVLEELVEGRVVNQVRVDDETASWAKVALERMLANKG